jgi:hypothetical protein
LITAYAAHIAEEYVFNWKKWVRDMTGMNVGWDEFFVINFAVIVSGLCFGVIGYKYPAVSLMYPALMAINGLFFHILPTAVKRKYSPGTATAILLFLPLAFMAYYGAYKLGLLNGMVFSVSITGGALMMAFPVALQKLKRLP